MKIILQRRFTYVACVGRGCIAIIKIYFDYFSIVSSVKTW